MNGSDDPTPWSPQSPNTTTMDFFLGVVSWVVYSRCVSDMDTLSKRITEAITGVKKEMLHKTWHKIEYHSDVLQATKGQHVEVY